jgi:hypothetical protein
MPIAVPDAFTLALWGLAALVAAFTCLPMLLAILGFTRVQITPTGGPETAEPTGNDPGYADLYDRLRQLGFEPLGGRVEIAWFFMWYWRRRSLPGFVLAGPGGECFASLYHLYVGDPWRLCFSTVMTDGTLVSTANQIERLRIDRPGYYRRGYVTQDLGELLRLHEAAVADFRARGYDVARPDLHEYCDVAARRTEEYLRESGKGKAAQCLATAAVAMGVLGVTAALFQEALHRWVIPGAVLAGALLFQLLMPTTIRSGAQKISREEQEGTLASRWARARRRRRWEGAALEAGPDEGVFPADQRRASPDGVQLDPPPHPPTDVTRPPVP